MISVFMYAFNALMPILILIFLGFFLKKINFLTDSFLDVGNRLMFRIALPAMLFVNVYNGIDSFTDIRWSSAIFAVIMVSIVFILGLVVAILFVKDKKKKGVVLQCSFRSNCAIIGLVLADGLGGPEAVAVMGLLTGFAVIMFNVLAVVSLTVFTDDEKTSFSEIIRGIITNPLIIGIAIGLVALLLKGIFPVDTKLKFLFSATENIGKLATPLALIVLGGKFSFEAGGGMLREIVIGTVMRVVVAPVLALSAAVFLTYRGLVSFGPADFPAFVAVFATPVAVSSAVMAAEMKSDADLAGQLVVWTSISSVITIFVFVVTLRTLGLM